MPATLTPTEVQAALGELSRLRQRMSDVHASFERIAMSADPATALEAAFALSAEVPEVRVFGTLDRVTEAELNDILAATTPDVTTRRGVFDLLERMRRAPRLHRALAHVHPFSFAPAGGRVWETYRAWLRRLRDQPLWGIPEPHVVPLGSVYIPQRYRDESTVRRLDPPDRPIEHDILSHLRATLTDTSTGASPLLCVVGGPGAGKSTLASMLASELAEDDLTQPLLVRLRDIRPELDLFDEIRRTLTESDSSMSEELVSVRHELAAVFSRAPRLVLLLDGFDELIQSSKTGLGSFFLRLVGLLRDQRVQSIVTFGRGTVFSRDDTAWPEETRVFSLLPFDDDQATAWCARWAEATGRAFDWRSLVGESHSPAHEPSTLTVLEDDTHALRSLAHEPLTLRLLALLDLEGVTLRDDDGGIDLARVYHKLIQETCLRHQSERGDFTASELRRLLRVIGYAVMQSGREVIRLDDLERALRALGLNVDTDKSESKATALILAISQRVSDRVERAWEFLHRSLGEYLAAEFLAAEIAAMVAEEHDEFGETRPRLDDAALCRRWIERFGPAMVSSGVERVGSVWVRTGVDRFLRKMAGDWPSFAARGVESDADRDLVRLSERLGKVYVSLLDETDAELVSSTARAWGMRWSDVTGTALANVFLLAGLRRTERVRFYPETHAAGRFREAYFAVHRATDSSAVDRMNAKIGFRGVAPRTNLDGLNLALTDWGSVVADTLALRRANLAMAKVYDASFAGCDLEASYCVGARFERVEFNRCSFARANLQHVKAHRLTFKECDLRGALIPLKWGALVPVAWTDEHSLLVPHDDRAASLSFIIE